MCFTKILPQSKLLAIKRLSYERREHRVNSVSFKTSLKVLVSLLEMLFVVTLSDDPWYPGREKKVAECWESLSFCIFTLHQDKQSETVTIPIEVSRHFLCFRVRRSSVNLDCRAEFQHSTEELTVEWLSFIKRIGRLQNSPYFCVNSTTHEQSNRSWNGERDWGEGFFSVASHALRARESRALRFSYSTLNRFWGSLLFFSSLTHWRIPNFF